MKQRQSLYRATGFASGGSMADSEHTDLFSPLRAGALKLPHRLVLAGLPSARPLAQGLPDAAMVEFYQRRSDAALMITEPVLAGSSSVVKGPGPCLEPGGSLRQWSAFSHDVRREGGRLALQLWKGQPSTKPQELRTWAQDVGRVAAAAMNLGFEAVEWILPQGWLTQGHAVEACLPQLNAAVGSGRLALRLNLQEPASPLDPGMQAISQLCAGQLAWLRVVASRDVLRPWTQPMRQWLRALHCPLILSSDSARPEDLHVGSQNMDADALCFGTAYELNPDLPQTLRQWSARSRA